MKALSRARNSCIQTQQRQTPSCLATKVALVFRFMNLRMISHVQFERVIDQLLFNIGEPKPGFLMQSRPVDWKFVCEFYDVDSSKTSRMAPKLTCRHLELSPFSTLQVKLALQRHSVATGMKVIAQWGIISEDATHTADFLEASDQ